MSKQLCFCGKVADPKYTRKMWKRDNYLLGGLAIWHQPACSEECYKQLGITQMGYEG